MNLVNDNDQARIKELSTIFKHPAAFTAQQCTNLAGYLLETIQRPKSLPLRETVARRVARAVYAIIQQVEAWGHGDAFRKALAQALDGAEEEAKKIIELSKRSQP